MIQPSPNSKEPPTSKSRGRGRKSGKPDVAGASGKPVQLTFFDYAARIGITLLPEAS